MEFIARFHDPDELARVRHLLRSKGIPTYVRGIEGRSMGTQDALFACLNHQAEDARRVIHNPDFEPAHPVDAREVERAMENADYRVILKWAIVVLGLVALLFGALMYLQFGNRV
ncbi:hypothetical protein [Agrilutibacter solisilvae]|uniref:DUF2007 domain-containing protein n=1 Tax=Agrilutibacter solisilvae TaxID=2763317 RepID=A0A975ATL0_9GAMM|nr:hypothetical protein [Lysobacter solisilvae]QSX79403.1 hypothetical protein I8J32_005950 [Lysobacter solisilvae]